MFSALANPVYGNSATCMYCSTRPVVVKLTSCLKKCAAGTQVAEQSHHLCWPVELEQQTCLACKQILPEIELCHPIAAHDAASGLAPGSFQYLCSIIAICLASCSRQCLAARLMLCQRCWQIRLSHYKQGAGYCPRSMARCQVKLMSIHSL